MSEEAHTPEDIAKKWADGKERTRANNPIYSEPYTLVDYLHEYRESRGRFTGKSDECREFAIRYLKKLNEEDDGIEPERYRRIIREALSRYDGPRKWRHGLGLNWEPSENTGRMMYYGDIYELTDEEAIELIQSEITEEAAKWTFLESIYDDVLRELSSHSEWTADELEIARIYNQGNEPDGKPYKPDIERYTENACKGIGWRYLLEWKPSTISAPEDPDEQERRRIAIEAIVSEVLKEHKADLEAAKEFEATGKLLDQYRVYKTVLRVTGRAPKLSEKGEISLEFPDVTEISTPPRTSKSTKDLIVFRTENIPDGKESVILRTEHFSKLTNAKPRTMQQTLQADDFVWLNDVQMKLKGDSEYIMSRLFMNNLNQRPTEAERSIPIQVGHIQEMMEAQDGHISPILATEFIGLIYGLEKDQVRPDNIKMMDAILTKLNSVRIRITPEDIFGRPVEGELGELADTDSPLLTYERVRFRNPQTKKLQTYYFFPTKSPFWRLNKVMNFYTIGPMLKKTPECPFDSEEWRALGIDDETDRRIRKHYEAEKLQMDRKGSPGLYLHPFDTLGIKEWTLRMISIQISIDLTKSRPSGNIIIDLKHGYREVYNEEPPERRSSRPMRLFRGRVKMYLLYLTIWGYVWDYTDSEKTDVINVIYTEKAIREICGKSPRKAIKQSSETAP